MSNMISFNIKYSVMVRYKFLFPYTFKAIYICIQASEAHKAVNMYDIYLV